MTVFGQYIIMVITTEQLISALSVFTCICVGVFRLIQLGCLRLLLKHQPFVGFFRGRVGRDELLIVWPIKQSIFLFGSHPVAIFPCRLCSNSVEVFLCQLLFYEFVTLVIKYRFCSRSSSTSSWRSAAASVCCICFPLNDFELQELHELSFQGWLCFCFAWDGLGLSDWLRVT